MRHISRIIVHCAATPPTLDIGVDEIRRWHLGRGFKTVGYHYVIRRSGEVELGRPVGHVGAHAIGHNADSIGICLVGGIDNEGEPDANFTPSQYESLRALIVTLRDTLPIRSVIGHRDTGARKACPSFDVREWLTEVGL